MVCGGEYIIQPFIYSLFYYYSVIGDHFFLYLCACIILKFLKRHGGRQERVRPAGPVQDHLPPGQRGGAPGCRAVRAPGGVPRPRIPPPFVKGEGSRVKAEMQERRTRKRSLGGRRKREEGAIREGVKEPFVKGGRRSAGVSPGCTAGHSLTTCLAVTCVRQPHSAQPEPRTQRTQQSQLNKEQRSTGNRSTLTAVNQASMQHTDTNTTHNTQHS